MNERANANVNHIEREIVKSAIPERFHDSNKGDYGRLLIVTGSIGMTGAGCLCAKSALRVGAGLVYLGVPKSLTMIYETNILETVTVPLEDKKSGHLTKESIKQIIDFVGKVDAVAVGPGLSISDGVEENVKEIILKSKIPVVLDADALNSICNEVAILKKAKAPIVITPHPGEMAKLLGVQAKEIQYNRIDIARKFAIEYNVITVLKGSGTVIAIPDGSIYVNTTGNAGMATAGTGDVLTGIIIGLIGQGVTAELAAICGVYIHGASGDRMAKIKGEHGLIASDVVEEIPYIIKELVES